ncbi:KIR protein, partial [Plasmodium coatneyi]
VQFPGRVISNVDFYNKFNTGKYGNSYDSIWPHGWQNKLDNVLQKNSGPYGVKGKIVKAYYYASKMKEDHPEDDTPCKFFYYWVGNFVSHEPDTTELSNVLKKVYGALTDTPYKNKCSVIYPDNDIWGKFDRMKELHNFSYDYGTIRSTVEKCNPEDYSKYLAYLHGIASSCKLVGTDCSEGQERSPHCGDFNKKYKDYCENEQPKLISLLSKCSPPKPKPNPNPNQAGSSGSFSDADVSGECELDDLPSKEAYRKFDEGEEGAVHGTTECTVGTVKAKLDTALKSYPNIKNNAENIAKAWCKIINGAQDQGGRGKKVDGPPYYLFHYWLGEKAWDSVDGNNPFKEIIGNIYLALGDGFNNIIRDRLCEDIDKVPFTQLKRVFEYSVDYSTIEACIEKFQTCGFNCTEMYSEYLNAAVSAHDGIREYCTQGKNFKNICCTHLQRMFDQSGGSNIPEPSELKSQLESLQKATVPEKETISSTTTSNTPAVASSTIALIGIPALGFYLYKVITTMRTQCKI